MKHEYPKMVYKNEKKAIVPFKDEVGYHWQVVESKEEHEALGSEWGEHPGLLKSEQNEEPSLFIDSKKKSKK